MSIYCIEQKLVPFLDKLDRVAGSLPVAAVAKLQAGMHKVQNWITQYPRIAWIGVLLQGEDQSPQNQARIKDRMRYLREYYGIGKGVALAHTAVGVVGAGLIGVMVNGYATVGSLLTQTVSGMTRVVLQIGAHLLTPDEGMKGGEYAYPCYEVAGKLMMTAICLYGLLQVTQRHRPSSETSGPSRSLVNKDSSQPELPVIQPLILPPAPSGEGKKKVAAVALIATLILGGSMMYLKKQPQHVEVLGRLEVLGRRALQYAVRMT